MINEKSLNDISGLTRKWKGWRSKAVGGICSLTASRKGSKLLIKTALGAVLCISLTGAWYSSRISSTVTLYSVQLNVSDPITNETETAEAVIPGLRMVVFGGGDAATPNVSVSKQAEQQYSWTEIMCQQLGCDSYISFIPQMDEIGGAVASNPLLDAAYKRVSNRDESMSKLDYSWVTSQFPRPTQHDLATQVSSFLSQPKPREVFSETVWVFNIGYWDIWYLAALPKRLAANVLDSSVRDLFFQIEKLYQAAQDEESIAFSDYYSDHDNSTPLETPLADDNYPRAPFRIFLTRLFDISLTPGFVSARPEPPHPHSRSDQLRNAAFLTKYWNALLEAAVDDWLAKPDPDYWSTADTIDIQVVKALVGKKSPGVGERYDGDEEGRDPYAASGIQLPFRAIASYGMSTYLQELMIDRQLRSTGLFDHNGLGARPPEYGFPDISMPCALPIPGDINRALENDTDAGAGDTVVVCQEPDSYLFYTEFILGRRAIGEIGTRAARRFLDQVEPRSKWREKAREREREQERERQLELEREKMRQQEMERKREREQEEQRKQGHETIAITT
ncbi:hypothetical protein GGR50DRAFT_356537 [Xylaria sp. CBS 124048]|nr:hypothetical protein GGR50DRAFT_356537 [Xylaria sp. CBS 124048]